MLHRLGGTCKAAEGGVAEAQNSLGNMYLRGLGVPQDYKQAAIWLRKAAEQGTAEAELNLGVLHDKGLGVTQDAKEAANWYRKAAEQGHAAAQDYLGGSCFQGQGVTRDPTLAYMLCSLAAKGGDAGGAKHQAMLKQNLTAKQLEEGQTLASSRKVGTPPPTTTKTGQSR
jgi:uncharacterized protein